MERIHKIWGHPLYQDQYMRLQEAERDRIFCNHTLSHFLDVARLMYLYALTDQVGLEKHLIYAAALLHDIGRYEQISIGTPHEQASAALAARILPECGYTKCEITAIRLAILGHRGEPVTAEETDRLTGETNDLTEEINSLKDKMDTPTGTINSLKDKIEAPAGTINSLEDRIDTRAETINIMAESEPPATGESLLSVYLRRADKQSRCCFACPAADQCNWPSEKRNSQISL